MSIINSQPRIGAAGQSTGFKIERSLRFNSADSAYLSRTPASAGNRQTWTWSGWVKRSGLTIESTLFSAAVDTNNFHQLKFDGTNNTIDFILYDGSVLGRLITTQVFRDTSAWYHIVAVWDTANATAGNRMRLYVNGSEITAFSTDTAPTQNINGYINAANAHGIGRTEAYNSNYFSGYMTEVYFIDGQALTPSSFGETDTDTGVWKPKAYSGSYGTNGFYLKFADNSGTTSTTLGKDSSGNGNNWTPNNFSVTAGAGNDSLVDTPTPYGTDTGAGGEVRGNYNTLSPLTTTNGTYTQGNLRFTGPSAWKRSNGTIAVSTGKWYWEVTLAANPEGSGSGNAYQAFGFGLSTVFNSTSGPDTQTDALVLADNNYYKNFSGSWTSNSTSFASGDVLSIAVDLDANTFTFRKNNSQLVTGTIGGTAGRELVPIIISYSGAFGVMDCNFGQRPFAYTAPSGFKALCTQNLPTPTIGATATTRADDYFDISLYSGNSSTQTITNSGMQPDFLWLKRRDSGGTNHVLFDAVRGTDKQLFSSLTNAEATSSSYLTSFNSNGFTLGSGDTGTNGTGATYVGWQWKANGAGSSNTQGSITSTVSANTEAGFSIARATLPSSVGASYGHGLGVAPAFIFAKCTSTTSDWFVYHQSLGFDKDIRLNTTAAVASTTATYNSANSTTVTIGGGNVNSYWGANTTWVFYNFAAVAGYSAFGSYTGNGSTDGPFIYLGFRPRYILTKNIDQAGQWFVWDSSRSPFNAANDCLFPESSQAETADNSALDIDLVSNGFKIRNTGSGQNNSAKNYIYAAFAEVPAKFSLAR